MNNYVANTYVGQDVTFNRQVWNCYGQKDRTTNICEGHHHAINAKFGGGRPDPFQFQKFLTEQEGSIERRVGTDAIGSSGKETKNQPTSWLMRL